MDIVTDMILNAGLDYEDSFEDWGKNAGDGEVKFNWFLEALAILKMEEEEAQEEELQVAAAAAEEEAARLAAEAKGAAVSAQLAALPE